mmetsp:Transcript_28858/g.70363  ORF Transcript_28858/g.70363 Transcript_28858/m.70363 type:complete len:175 (-) Transcript_28858:445-969(-)
MSFLCACTANLDEDEIRGYALETLEIVLRGDQVTSGSILKSEASLGSQMSGVSQTCRTVILSRVENNSTIQRSRTIQSEHISNPSLEQESHENDSMTIQNESTQDDSVQEDSKCTPIPSTNTSFSQSRLSSAMTISDVTPRKWKKKVSFTSETLAEYKRRGGGGRLGEIFEAPR